MAHLTGIIRRGATQYVGLCLELDVASVGDTQEETAANLRDAIASLVSYLREEGREHELMQRRVTPERLREFLLNEEEEAGELEMLLSLPQIAPLEVLTLA